MDWMYPILLRGLVVAVAIAGIGLASRPVPRASGQYRNCTQAHQDGRYDIPQDDPDYWPGGDRDGDGIACES
jgi:excalibur calcium-binding domain-containing protein